VVIVNLLGGLGNQMFQYAFAYSFSRKNNVPVKLDILDFNSYKLRTYELELYNISLDLANYDEVCKLKYKQETIFEKIIRVLKRSHRPFAISYIQEKDFTYNPKIFEQKDDLYLKGYWQSEKYFIEFRNELLKEFCLKDKLHKKNQLYKQTINQYESVSLHIRRGDYVIDMHTNSVHGTCSLEYYKKAVDYMISKLNNPHFFIFSDDLTWAYDNINFIENITFVDIEDKIPDHEEMYLMSQCKHNIIANSSFSWWGAWLNQNSSKIVIAPKKWFNDKTINTKDLIPNEWIRL